MTLPTQDGNIVVHATQDQPKDRQIAESTLDELKRPCSDKGGTVSSKTIYQPVYFLLQPTVNGVGSRKQKINVVPADSVSSQAQDELAAHGCPAINQHAGLLHFSACIAGSNIIQDTCEASDLKPITTAPQSRKRGGSPPPQHRHGKASSSSSTLPVHLGPMGPLGTVRTTDGEGALSACEARTRLSVDGHYSSS